jgi:myosin heavy subunit
MFAYRTLLSFIGLLLCISLCAQSSGDSIQFTPSISNKYLDQVASKSGKLESKLDQQSDKELKKLQKQEERIRKKLQKIDSTKAKEIFENGQQAYQNLESKISQGSTKLKKYIPSLDTLSTSLKFLQQNPQLLSTAKETKEKLENAMEKVKGLQTQFQKAEEIKKFLKERKEYLKSQLGNLGSRHGGQVAKELKKMNKQVYYYSQQVNEYKEALKDHKKAEKKAIELLSKTKLFKDFMRKNSELASLFRLPGDPNDPNAAVSLAGLQTRSQVNNLIQQQIAAGGPNAQQQFQQNMQQAQSQLNEIKNKLMKLGGGSSDMEMPEGFKPNNQKTKTFLERLEYGANMQSQKANGWFPVTSDIGLSIGYKLNDKSILGIGASYKIGWGPNINNIKITHQGMGLRSFVDWKVKGSFWLTGGFEMNYKTEINNIQQLQDFSAWQQSGLLGISKQISLKSKILKKTKLQLLWDFLSYQQVPRTQPVLFRIGYIF